MRLGALRSSEVLRDRARGVTVGSHGRAVTAPSRPAAVTTTDGAAFKNGPRLWCLDWVEVMAGKERNFNGLKGDGSVAGRAQGDAQARERRLQQIHVERDTRLGSNAGRLRFCSTIRRTTRGA